MSTLLSDANRLLTGDLAVASEARRGACWLARAALEDAVRGHLEALGHRTGKATMHSLLACLESVHRADPRVAQTARHAWIGLSHASHHAAYDLAPTLAEVRHLLGLVAQFIEATGGSTGAVHLWRPASSRRG